jgi:uncharacterized protein (UPF0335 family)
MKDLVVTNEEAMRIYIKQLEAKVERLEEEVAKLRASGKTTYDNESVAPYNAPGVCSFCGSIQCSGNCFK